MASGKSKAVIVLVPSLTDNGKVYSRGYVEFDPSDTLLAAAESKRKNGSGQQLCRVLTASERQTAAKRVKAKGNKMLLADSESGQAFVKGDTEPEPAEEEELLEELDEETDEEEEEEE